MNLRKNHFLSEPRKPRVLLLSMAFVVMFAAACGKKGPLYLPDTAAPAKTGGQTVNPVPAQPEKN